MPEQWWRWRRAALVWLVCLSVGLLPSSRNVHHFISLLFGNLRISSTTFFREKKKRFNGFLCSRRFVSEHLFFFNVVIWGDERKLYLTTHQQWNYSPLTPNKLYLLLFFILFFILSVERISGKIHRSSTFNVSYWLCLSMLIRLLFTACMHVSETLSGTRVLWRSSFCRNNISAMLHYSSSPSLPVCLSCVISGQYTGVFQKKCWNEQPLREIVHFFSTCPQSPPS